MFWDVNVDNNKQETLIIRLVDFEAAKVWWAQRAVLGFLVAYANSISVNTELRKTDNGKNNNTKKFLAPPPPSGFRRLHLVLNKRTALIALKYLQLPIATSRPLSDHALAASLPCAWQDRATAAFQLEANFSKATLLLKC